MPRTDHCSVIVILLRSMACFFRCFGVRYTDRRHLVSSSDPTLSTPAEPVVSKHQKQSSLALLEERDSHVLPAAGTEFDDWELKDEAKFLKACGTLQETPDEIRKMCKKLTDSAEQDSELKYHSWLTNISTSELLENEKLSGQFPTPVRFDKVNATEPAAVDSPTPSSVINEHSDVSISISSLKDGVADNTNNTADLQANGKPDATNISIPLSPAAGKSEHLNRSVRFATQSFSSENSPRTCIQHRDKQDLKDLGSLVKRSPYPTPLNLRDNMQTPGTVLASGTNARVRSQYVSMNPSEFTDNSTISEMASLGPSQNANCNSKLSLSGSSVKESLPVGNDLSSLIKTPALDGAGNERKYQPGGIQGDRPILGLVAEHWKEEDVLNISPREWDGNGIPNTTTKYKEDQKVRWHATPFEERLEKALSEDTFISRRAGSLNGILQLRKLDDGSLHL